MQLQKFVSVIPKGKSDGIPAYTRGGAVRAIGLPTNRDGSIALTGRTITFAGSLDGSAWFTVCDYAGAPVQVQARAVQQVIPAGSMGATAPAFLPIQQSRLFEGLQMVMPIVNAVEPEQRSLVLYFE
jgi:hypothetical protein